MKNALMCLAVVVALSGSAAAQIPSGMADSAKVGADRAAAKANSAATSTRSAADSTTEKAVQSTEAAKDTARTTDNKAEAKAAGAKKDAVDEANKSGSTMKGKTLDLNTASQSELAALPGVGPGYAKKILESRPFDRKEQLVSKKILTPATYAKVKDLVVAKRPSKT